VKPQTFAQMILDAISEFLEGYKTSAQNEGGAQEKIDRLLKQRWGVSLEHQDFGGTKIREIAYPNPQSRGQIADFSVILNKTERNSSILKKTVYFVEVKSQSGGSGKFSGMIWKVAFRSDIEKLRPIANWIPYASFMDQVQGHPRSTGRCFAVLLSFHPDTSAEVVANHAMEFPGSVCLRSLSSYPYAPTVLVIDVQPSV